MSHRNRRAQLTVNRADEHRHTIGSLDLAMDPHWVENMWARVPFISYHSAFLLAWQLILVAAVMYVSVTVPVVFAWGEDKLLKNDKCVDWMYEVDLAVDTFFIMDILLTFNTTYCDEVTGEEVRDRRCIAYRYVVDPREGKWIVFDTVASLPTSYIQVCRTRESGSTEQLKFVKLIRFTKLFKMLRMVNLNGVVDMRHRPLFHPVMMRFVRILLALLFVWHLFACLYWKVAIDTTECPKNAFGEETACWGPPTNVRLAPFARQYSAPRGSSDGVAVSRDAASRRGYSGAPLTRSVAGTPTPLSGATPTRWAP